ncbi:MAG: metal-dependent transcriptional regulator [Promethearchaeota archaeon]
MLVKLIQCKALYLGLPKILGMNPAPETKSENTTETPSASVQEYLEAILRLLNKKEGYVKTGELAKYLGVVPASVTDKVKKNLTKKNYVVWKKGKGFKLTNKGRKIALDVLRRHRIAERLLVDLLGVSWEEAHDMACEWEHVLTEEQCNRVLEKLDDPATCPHGNPIPSANGTLHPLPELSLADLDQGEEVTIDCISDENLEILRMMASMGMLPGERVRVIQVSPIGDTLLIEVGTAQFALSCDLAGRIRVRRDEEE